MKTAFGWLARLFPRSFRERFGPEVVEHAARECERDGRFLATAFDICRAAFAERLRPTWAGATAEKGRPMNATLSGWGAELRHAVRTLRRTPGFTLTVVGTLGLAIGTITGVFAVLDKVLLSPLPFAHSERLVFIAGEAPGRR